LNLELKIIKSSSATALFSVSLEMGCRVTTITG
jgi:hypothetical protein